MRYNEFIQKVQQHAHLKDAGRAEEVARAVLETLGGRVDSKTRKILAADLPHELKEYLDARPNEGYYNLDEFYNRVGARTDVGVYDAAEYSKAVMAALQEAVPQSEIEDIRQDLPREFSDLFVEGPLRDH